MDFKAKHESESLFLRDTHTHLEKPLISRSVSYLGFATIIFIFLAAYETQHGQYVK